MTNLTNLLLRGGAKRDQVLETLEFIGQNSTPPLNREAVESLILPLFDRHNVAENGVAEAVKEWVLSTHGHFMSTDIQKDLDLSTRVHKKNLSEILRRMVKDGLIERYGNKNGHFRKLDDDLVKMDLTKTSGDVLDFAFPLGIHKYCSLYPGNIAVVAGAPNAGKTGFLLNCIALNMHRHKINYFNSEAGGDELRDRLDKFDLEMDSWKFDAYERSGNFADVIKPGEVNIIDFLEVHEDFWAVGKEIRKVHDKLKGGLAIIAIQKKVSTKHATYDLGRGAEFALEKPRLYLSLDPGRIKIVKAKKWANPDVQPNGLTREYKLAQGCHFHPVDRWMRPEEWDAKNNEPF